eukprot:TRINITY_DN1781_c0_g1_i3.p1 TRINITY_DN1781_c0_g1~~TRINITY_DN1781_c0_g1_i3.p1  ORF type:complete len:800 (+),score=120.20 TRINITY_DN1781_c0_g1_i3:66-2465(+)
MDEISQTLQIIKQWIRDQNPVTQDEDGVQSLVVNKIIHSTPMKCIYTTHKQAGCIVVKIRLVFPLVYPESQLLTVKRFIFGQNCKMRRGSLVLDPFKRDISFVLSLPMFFTSQDNFKAAFMETNSSVEELGRVAYALIATQLKPQEVPSSPRPPHSPGQQPQLPEELRDFAAALSQLSKSEAIQNCLKDPTSQDIAVGDRFFHKNYGYGCCLKAIDQNRLVLFDCEDHHRMIPAAALELIFIRKAGRGSFMRKYHTADENILDFDISIRVGLHCSFLPGDRIKKRSRSGTVIGVHKNRVWVHWDSYLGAEPLEDVLETVLVCRYGLPGIGQGTSQGETYEVYVSSLRLFVYHLYPGDYILTKRNGFGTITGLKHGGRMIMKMNDRAFDGVWSIDNPSDPDLRKEGILLFRRPGGSAISTISDAGNPHQYDVSCDLFHEIGFYPGQELKCADGKVLILGLRDGSLWYSKNRRHFKCPCKTVPEIKNYFQRIEGGSPQDKISRVYRQLSPLENYLKKGETVFVVLFKFFQKIQSYQPQPSSQAANPGSSATPANGGGVGPTLITWKEAIERSFLFSKTTSVAAQNLNGMNLSNTSFRGDTTQERIRSPIDAVEESDNQFQLTARFAGELDSSGLLLADNDIQLPTHNGNDPIALGAGAQGIVLKGFLKRDTPVAVKRMELNGKGIGSLKVEIKYLKDLRHQNIVQLYGVLQGKGTLNMVMELCEGDLIKYISNLGGTYGPKHVTDIAEQTLTGLSFLHSSNVIHRDLKPENVLYVKGLFKISDMGLSIKQGSDSNIAGTVA